MTGTPTSRRWIKLYPERCLNGSIRYQLTSGERGVWYDLLCFASLCNQGGKMADRDGRPYPDDFVANRLNIKTELFNETVKKCLEEGRLVRNDGGCLEIKNWNTYQSEYERQCLSRQKGKKIYGEFKNVLLTEDEYIKLKTKFKDIAEKIESLSAYIESKGAKYKSHYATILNWDRRDKEGGQGGTHRQNNEGENKYRSGQEHKPIKYL